MDQSQKKPPQSRNESTHAPKGTYIPSIDPNLYIAKNAEEIFLYFSRLSYRHWVWDEDLEKYIEESAILGVQMTTDWWNDPDAKTMPTIIEDERDRFASQAHALPDNITSYNGTGKIGYPPRKECVLSHIVSCCLLILFPLQWMDSCHHISCGPPALVRV
jgi:hypothetical protein